jgi:hypothetical protein
MSFKKPYLAIALLGVALASGAAWWLQNKPAGPKEKVSASGAPLAALLSLPPFRLVHLVLGVLLLQRQVRELPNVRLP